jgi:3-oxoacyl-[acyl-carrier-protein] synthase III
LVLEALDRALRRAGLSASDLDGLVACPSLAEPRFMEVAYLANADFLPCIKIH